MAQASHIGGGGANVLRVVRRWHEWHGETIHVKVLDDADCTDTDLETSRALLWVPCEVVHFDAKLADGSDGCAHRWVGIGDVQQGDLLLVAVSHEGASTGRISWSET